MRKLTLLLLIICLLLNISEIILSLVVIIIKDEIITKKFALADIIINIIAILYIIYRFCYIKSIFTLFIMIKFAIFLFNIAGFAFLVYIGYKNEDNYGKILPRKNYLIYAIYEFIFVLKFYIHVCSIYRVYKDFKNHNWDINCCFVVISSEQEENENINTNTMQNKEEELQKFKEENNFLKEENQRLKIDKLNTDNNIYTKKKIEIICDYIKSNHGINISSDILFEKLLLEIKNKCDGLIIDKKKYEEIILDYIKQKIFKYLICPITSELFSNPYITPDGYTFDRIAILKNIQTKGINPITKKKLNADEIIENKLVLDIIEVIKLNDEFNIKLFQEIKTLLKSKSTKKIYEYPYVIAKGNNRGNTEEKNNFIFSEKYPNLVIMNMIKGNSEIFEDDFLKFDFEPPKEEILEVNSNKKINKINTININNDFTEDKKIEKIDKPRRELPDQ